MSSPTSGGWIVDDEDSPAMLVRVGRLQFSADTASVFIADMRAGRWGKGVQCVVVKQSPDHAWTVKRCDIIEQY